METILNDPHSFTLGRYSAVFIASRFELDGPGFEPECGRYVPHPYKPTRYPATHHRVLSRDKAAGVWRYHPPQSSAGVEEEYSCNSATLWAEPARHVVG